jgi:hypothetical protein
MRLLKRFAPIACFRKRLLREDVRFERSLGIDATGKATPSELTVVDGDATEAHLYTAEHVRVTRWWLSALPTCMDEFDLVDMGSGKGRVLFAAAMHGFHRAFGIEFAKELHEQAEANVKRAAPLGARSEIILLLEDARTFEFPLNPLVIHFNNPFSEAIMEEVIVNLTASYEQRPRPIFAIYQQAAKEHRYRTRNAELLAAVPAFIRHRRLSPGALGDKLLLAVSRVDVCETREAVELTDRNAESESRAWFKRR